jgi:hypothetical protein
MEGCWHRDPAQRWGMERVVDALSRLKNEEEQRELNGNVTPALTPRGGQTLSLVPSMSMSMNPTAGKYGSMMETRRRSTRSISQGNRDPPSSSEDVIDVEDGLY